MISAQLAEITNCFLNGDSSGLGFGGKRAASWWSSNPRGAASNRGRQENRDGGFLGPHSPSCSPKGAGQMGALVEAGRAWGQQASYGLCEPSPAPAAGSQLQELGASGGPRSWLQHDGGETALQRKGAPCVEDSNREEA